MRSNDSLGVPFLDEQEGMTRSRRLGVEPWTRRPAGGRVRYDV